ncbi:hypothetical protein EUA06_09040 [Nocardioides glacieisoli]|uniref:DUF3558 domain-containing protein n=1 Tax=Nocardioides glacieisoli TaxID=1168730 RepID=A0A4Q2RR63_9ACTN|nr:hypothetical protein [Nocardioides glacieisoli]RYB91460.1 hypothetical protein EUA06_09040 [Nocardioides glacieisoli]
MPRSSPLLATLLALCVVLGACSSSSDAPDGPERTDSTSRSTDASGTATPTEPEAAGEEAIMVGDFRHRPACRLLTPEDAIELLPLTGEADFAQDQLAGSPSEEDFPDPDAVEPALAITSCAYQLGDASNTRARLEVKEYVDEKTARSEWTTIKRFGERRLPPRLTGGPTTFQELDAALQAILEDARESVGGVRVPGIDPRILWRTGSTEFVATAGNLFLTFDRAENFGFTPKLTKKDAALAERVLLRAIEHAADDELPTTPLPPFFEQDEDWPAFLDPCSLLDADGAETLLGARPETVSTSSIDLEPDVNLGADSAAGRSLDNSCEWRTEDRRGTAELHVQYVAPDDTAEDVLDSYLGNFLFEDPTPSRRQVDRIRDSMTPGGLSDVDVSYVLVLSGETSSFRSYLLLDRYVLELTGSLRQGRYGSRSVDTASLREAGQLVAANLAAAVAAG